MRHNQKCVKESFTRFCWLVSGQPDQARDTTNDCGSIFSGKRRYTEGRNNTVHHVRTAVLDIHCNVTAHGDMCGRQRHKVTAFTLSAVERRRWCVSSVGLHVACKSWMGNPLVIFLTAVAVKHCQFHGGGGQQQERALSSAVW